MICMWYSFYAGLDIIDDSLFMAANDYYYMVGTDEIYRFNSILHNVYHVEMIWVYDEISREIIAEYKWDDGINRYRFMGSDSVVKWKPVDEIG